MDRIFSTLLVATIICGSLANSGTFLSPTLTAYFCYTITVTLLVLLTLAVIFISKKVPLIDKQKRLTTGLFLGWIIFYLLQPLLCHFSVNLDHAYFLAHLFLFVSLVLLFGIDRLRPSMIFLIASLFAVAECVICFLQLVGFVKPFNKFFSVTGTWVNPNVTAMFLAMSLPAICYTALWHEGKNYRYISFAATVFLFVALLLLQCRAALLAAGVVIGIIFAYRYSLFQKIGKLSCKKRIASVVLCSLMLALVVVGGYYEKENSTAGRLLIWKLCVSLGMEQAFTGHGLGTFERNYNLYQASYFDSGIATNSEKQIASYIRMAYCEPLQNFVEGGFVAALLFIAMLLSVLIKPPSKTNTVGIAAYAGIAGFFVMSIANFTVQAIPVMCLLVIYLTIYIVDPVQKINNLSIFRRITCGALFMIGLLFGARQWKLAREYNSLQEINRLAFTQKRNDTLLKMTFLENELSNESLFWKTYARLLCENHNYTQSLSAIEKAISLTPDPGLYLQAARIHAQLKQYNAAEQKFNDACNLEPYKMEPVVGLMELYKEIGSHAKASQMARTVLQMKPRGISANAERYKQAASELLKTYSLVQQTDTARPAYKIVIQQHK
ncbi:O-antigen ligase family protein [Pinibacter soli]|uniref:O-antigen ligase family protein n=1 Tax=Pinibacter soli TaxID=3044211 RepID=A0ABT6R6N2_9BACT|nr:O-antigen ligase family protein [Pinibacter soli]MDI3318228.1 O-antigen ligase family protein [Pinibacter soli]